MAVTVEMCSSSLNGEKFVEHKKDTTASVSRKHGREKQDENPRNV